MSLARMVSALIVCILSTALLLGVPQVTGVSPNRGTAAGGDSVTVTGTGFTGATQVFFGPTAVAVTPDSDTQITVISPTAVPGTVHLVVQVGSETSPTSPADRFTYQGSWFAYISETSPEAPTLRPIDLSNNTPKEAILLPGEGWPFGVALPPNGRGVYVGNYDWFDPGYLHFVDIPTNAASSLPYTAATSCDIVAAAPDGTVVYPTLVDVFSIGQIDVVSNTFLANATDDSGNNPIDVAVTPDGTKLYVCNTYQDTVTVFTKGSEGFVKTKTISIPNAFRIAITPNGQEAYVIDGADMVYAINTSTDEVTDTITNPSAENLYALAIDPKGEYVYAVELSADGLVKIRTSDKSVTHTLSTGIENLNTLAIAPDGRTAYTSSEFPTQEDVHRVAVIDLTQDQPTVTTIIEIPDTIGYHFYMAITPDQAPAADFVAAVAPSGMATVFDASQSVSPVGTIVQYEWDFGDGTPSVTTSGPTVSHTYAEAGTYTVGLTVTNSAGTSIQKTFTGHTMSNNGSYENAHYELAITVPSGTPCRPRHFCGKVNKHHRHLSLRSHWKKSSSSNVVKYQIYKNKKKVCTTTKTHFKKHLHPKRYYRHHLHDYKKYLERRYRVRAVNGSGGKSSFTKLRIHHMP